MDALGDRMKQYEKARLFNRLDTDNGPICVRIDGRNFSRFTKDLVRPFDKRLIAVMQETTKYLMQETNACFGYTQSDEISLIFWVNDNKKQIFVDGKVQKLVSLLASMATLKFNTLLPDMLPFKARLMPMFDCRVWQVPTLKEAANVILWRQLDCQKNAISMAAQSMFSHNQLQDKHSGHMLGMMADEGINFYDYPKNFTHGTPLVRKEINTPFSMNELNSLPPLHRARFNRDLIVTRHVIEPSYLESDGIDDRVSWIFGEVL